MIKENVLEIKKLVSDLHCMGTYGMVELEVTKIEKYVKELEGKVKNLTIPVVMPRYFIDERAGCAAVRDREHAKYDKAYQGLHQDTPDVVVYAHGFQNHEKGCWEMKDTDINYIKLECDRLNRLNGA